MSQAADTQQIAPEDRGRAELYSYLATLLAAPPPQDLLDRSAGLAGDGSTAIGRAIGRIARDAGEAEASAIEREYTRLFIGLGRGELLPFASHYITGNLHDKPLARLRSDMRRLGIARTAGVSEPEDHLASIFEMMAGQILGRYGAVAPVVAQKSFFAAHLEPWAARFFTDLQAAENARFYRGVGDLGAAFIAVEMAAFDLS